MKSRLAASPCNAASPPKTPKTISSPTTENFLLTDPPRALALALSAGAVIVRLDQGRYDDGLRERLGGKAAGLVRLAELGLPVPAAVAVPVAVTVPTDSAQAQRRYYNNGGYYNGPVWRDSRGRYRCRRSNGWFSKIAVPPAK